MLERELLEIKQYYNERIDCERIARSTKRSLRAFKFFAYSSIAVFSLILVRIVLKLYWPVWLFCVSVFALCLALYAFKLLTTVLNLNGTNSRMSYIKHLIVEALIYIISIVYVYVLPGLAPDTITTLSFMSPLFGISFCIVVFIVIIIILLKEKNKKLNTK